MSIPFLASGNDVTIEWLAAVLDTAGATEGAELVSMTAAPIGSGQMGENVRFVLEWSAPDHPLGTVVGKFPSDDETSRATGVATGAYEKEVNFYREIAPTVDIRTPRCYHVDGDSQAGTFVLILEDLAPRRQGDQIAGCATTEVELVIDQLVGLQAPRWDDPTLHDVDWLGRRTDESAMQHSGLYSMLLPGWESSVGSMIDPQYAEVARVLDRQMIDWLNLESVPLVLTHGDFRLDNMMFHDEVGLAVVDWQTVGHGAPTNDLSYFMGTGPTPDLRREIEGDVVRRYHSGLTAAGVGFDWDLCWDLYRRSAPAGLLMSVIASQIVVATDRGNAMFAAMAERSAAMALDLGSFDLV